MRHPFQADLDTIAALPAVPRILDVVCDSTGMGFAAVARVTEDRWIACQVRDGIRFGLLAGEELTVETTICHEIRRHGAPVVIDDSHAHPAFRDHKAPAMYGFRSYISVPILLPDGRFFGTLCAIDPAPRRLSTPATTGMFHLFAEMIGFQIEAQERLARSQAELGEERAEAVLREQFIAVLGHDLRNPLASVDACMRLLARSGLEDKPLSLVEHAQRSVRRMADLVADMMDLARSRLRDGIPLTRGRGDTLEAGLRQVVAEAASGAPGRVVDAQIELRQPVRCDTSRVVQLCSNLLANALQHGTAAMPVRLRATTGDGLFTLEVSNAGRPIPPAALAQLFQPYFRGADQQGLGLGLFIAAEIARAHGGSLRATSDTTETRFTFTLPLEAGPVSA